MIELMNDPEAGKKRMASLQKVCMQLEAAENVFVKRVIAFVVGAGALYWFVLRNMKQSVDSHEV